MRDKRKSPWRKVINLCGMKFGKLRVIALTGRKTDKGELYRCECDCGNITTVPRGYLINGHTKSCGCEQIESRHRRLIDLTGKRFGRLTVLRKDTEHSETKRIKWICQCDCGNVVSILGNNLVRGNTLSCGCLASDHTRDRLRKDITGQRFGRLVAIEPCYDNDNRKYKSSTRWKCKCDCGNTAIVDIANLMNGHTRSCGCINEELQTTHGLTTTEIGRHLSGIYITMLRRCYNPKVKDYPNYGGRGIYVCDEWRNFTPRDKNHTDGLIAFYNWAIENGYQIGLSIDHIDNDGPYAPWNCRWVTNKMQANNKRTSKYIRDIDGELLTYAQFEEKHQLRYQYVSKRLRYCTVNELLYDVYHPELGMHKVHHRFIDKDGFEHMIPNYGGRPHGKKI